MLEQILGLIKEYAEQAVNANTEIPEDKKQQTVQVTTEAVTDGLKQHLTPSNLSSLSSLFRNSTANTAGNPIVNGIKSMLTNALMQKVGLPQGTSNSFASGLVPSLISMLSSKMNNSSGSGFNLESLVNAFSGSNNDQHGNILGTLGNFFK
ncbi:MAG: hypothetical protein LUD15_08235 [Bacteroides sp.]|nr:hypothetical protein [Bacteroides sp.]